MQYWVPIVNCSYCVTVKKKDLSVTNPTRSQQVGNKRAVVASIHIVHSSVAELDNRGECFESLTWAPFTSPQVDKVKMDDPN